MGNALPLPLPGDSLKTELTKLRAALAAIYQSHAPTWHGASYATRREYPVVIDDLNSSGWTEGNNARTGVWACDWMLWLLQTARTRGGYMVTKKQLTDFALLYAIVDEMRTFSIPHVRRALNSSVERTRDRPAKMRAARAELLAIEKQANHQAALAAWEELKRRYPTQAANRNSGLAKKAAEQLDVSVSMFYRRLRKPK